VEQRAELGQRDRPCGPLPLGGRERGAGVLLVEQCLPLGLHARGQLEARQLSGNYVTSIEVGVGQATSPKPSW
jgi:hypothetical protein